MRKVFHIGSKTIETPRFNSLTLKKGRENITIERWKNVGNQFYFCLWKITRILYN